MDLYLCKCLYLLDIPQSYPLILDVCLSILNVMHEGFQDDKYAACNLLKQMVNNNELGVKTGKGFYVYSEGLKNKKVSPNFLK